MKVSGVIDSISSKTVSNGGTVYTATIDGQDVNLGFQCNYSEGEFVELEVESTKWGLQVPRNPGGRKTGGASAAPRTPSKAAPANKSQQFPVDPNSKDHVIIRQNALTNANAAVRAAIDAGAFKPKTKEEVYNEVITVSYNLTGFAMGTLDAKLVEAAKAAEADSKAKEANDE